MPIGGCTCIEWQRCRLAVMATGYDEIAARGEMVNSTMAVSEGTSNYGDGVVTAKQRRPLSLS